MSNLSDTIAAPATPQGTSALAVVRVSGPLVETLALDAFGAPTLAPRVATHRNYLGVDGRMLDDVIAVRFAGPNSFTGENLLEICTHGSPLIVQQVLGDLVLRGCRLAEPGEFTRRAFLNGRIDLMQAEAVIDVIHARSEKALMAAQQQLQGSLGRHISIIKEQLLQLLARVEAYIDFPDEDLPDEDQQAFLQEVQQVLRGTGRLLATHQYGDLLRDGVKTVIIGEPNVGKSSLLNALVGRERALVSPEPGTTRDYVEERLTIGPHLFRLIDTAGLNPAPGQVERLGIEKTLERAAEAQMFLVVLDATRPAPPLPEPVRCRVNGLNTIVVLNKADLLTGAPVAEVDRTLPSLQTSARAGTGIEQLAAALGAAVDRLHPEDNEDLVAINARHADALARAEAGLRAAERQIKERQPAELQASHLRVALEAVAEIAGRVDHEEILDRLFSTFCIGK